MSDNTISFTVRRPSPASRAPSSGADSDEPTFKVPALLRHVTNGGSKVGTRSPLARSATSSPGPNSISLFDRGSDSSDGEDGEAEDELVTGFDQFGVQRLHEKKPKFQGPLVIPALKNKDWKAIARKRRQYIPEGTKTGEDGSVGGLGTKDSMDPGTMAAGLHQIVKMEVDDEGVKIETQIEVEVAKEETEDQKAIRALLAGDAPSMDAPVIGVIPPPVSEADAYKQDMAELPDEASLEDYNRMPVSQFGAALLRGMGWKEGMAASRTRKGMAEPWVPVARPQLLGLGATEKEVLDDGSPKKKGSERPEKRYVPVIKQKKEGGSRDSGTPLLDSRSSSRRRSRSPRRDAASAPVSRRTSRSPSPGRKRYADEDRGYERERDRTRDRERDRDRDRYRDGDRDRERDRDRDRDKERDKRRDRESDRAKDDSRYDSSGRRRDRDRKD